MIDLERGEIPSASAAERNTYCPGSHALSLVAPPPDADSVTGRGLLLHELLSQTSPVDMAGFAPDERWVLEQCVYIKQSIQAEFNFEDAEVHLEKRYFYFDHTRKRMRFSGRVDVVCVNHDDRSALIIDYKTGWKGAPEAERNLQLRWLAALIYRNFPVSKVYVAIIQPMVSEMPFSIAVYDDERLEKVCRQIIKACNRIDAKNPPRIPGPIQCDWCQAKKICPEAHSVAKRIPAFKFDHLKGAQAMEFIDACKTAKKIIADAERFFADMLEVDDTAFPGYTTRTKKTTSVKDGRNIDLYKEVKDLIDASTFANEISKVSISKIVDHVWKNSDMGKAKAKEFVMKKIKDHLYTFESKPFLAMTNAKADRKQLAIEYDPTHT